MTAFRNKIRSMTNGSTNAVVLSSPSSKRANTCKYNRTEITRKDMGNARYNECEIKKSY